jgi:hypothetical protein
MGTPVFGWQICFYLRHVRLGSRFDPSGVLPQTPEGFAKVRE